MLTKKPLLPGESDPDLCMCGKPRNKPSLLCQRCYDDFVARTEEHNRRAALAEIERLFDGKDSVPVELFLDGRKHLLTYMDHNKFRLDYLEQVFRRFKAADIEDRPDKRGR